MRRLFLAAALAAVAVTGVPASATPACVGAYTSGTPADRYVRQCVPNSGDVRCFDIWVNLPTGGHAVVWVCYPLIENDRT